MPTTEYMHVRFKPRMSGSFKAYDSKDAFVGIVSPNVFSTMPEDDYEGSDIVRVVTFEELSDIHHFMSELRKDGDE